MVSRGQRRSEELAALPNQNDEEAAISKAGRSLLESGQRRRFSGQDTSCVG